MRTMAGDAFRVVQGLNSSQLGGAELVALRLGLRLRDCGDRVSCAVPGPGPAWWQCRRLGLPAGIAPVLEESRSWTRVAGMLRSVSWVAMQLADSFGRFGRSGILHVHSPVVYRTLGLAARLVGAAVVCHVHSLPSRKLLEWAFRDPPDGVIVCADDLRRVVEPVLERYGRSTQMVAMANPVDVSRFFPPRTRAEARRALGVDASTQLVAVVGDLSPNKGIDVAIEVFAKAVTGRKIQARLWVVGEERVPCGYQRYLERVAVETGVADRVDFLGFRCDSDRILRAADVLLLCSHSEGMPLSVLEAQASGALVIASSVGGIPEIVRDGETGWLVRDGDVEGFASRLRSVLENTINVEAVRERAIAWVRERHDERDYVRRLREFYGDTLQRVRNSGLGAARSVAWVIRQRRGREHGARGPRGGG